MRPERKRKLALLLIGLFIALGFTILAIQKMMDLISVEQDLSKSTGIPIQRIRRYIISFILLPLVPAVYFLGQIILILGENAKA